MPTLAAGNPDWPAYRVGQNALFPIRMNVRQASGFTLLELLVVLAIVAIASAGVGMAMRDGSQTQLEREAVRLAALLESARARAQLSGVPVRWQATAQGFRFSGLPSNTVPHEDDLPQTWLDPSTRATSPVLLLGPDPIIAPQTVTLSVANQPQRQVRVATDGVRPFALQPAL